jgi:hypothetical protein
MPVDNYRVTGKIKHVRKKEDGAEGGYGGRRCSDGL